METLLIITAIIISIVGLIGCIVPALPGPPLNFIAILLIQWAFQPFATNFLLVTGALVVVVTVLDFFLPVWIAKKFGASREGITGSIVGLIVGLLFAPIGIIFGLIAGAIIGDLISGKKLGEAVYSGFGSALGTLFSTGFKLMLSGVLTWYVFREIFRYFAG